VAQRQIQPEEGKHPSIRLDKWLWHARFFKTRGLATKLVSGGHVHVNADKVSKPAFGLKVGDILSFPQGKTIRVVKVLTLSTRRGPATEAQALYEDRTPIRESVPGAPRTEGKGRPTKKDRRTMLLSNPRMLE
jgi:ribosome-associated heat shock protein Hsp15